MFLQQLLIICPVPGPILEARHVAISKMQTGPSPCGVHILVRGGKVVNDPSVQAIPVIPVCLLWKNKAMGIRLPYPGQYISESVHAYMPMVITVLGSVFRVLWRLLVGERGVVG